MNRHALSLEAIRRFLEVKGWSLAAETAGRLAWRAPDDFGLPETYRLYLPQSDATLGGANTAARISVILSELYELPLEELAAEASYNHAILALRLQSPDFESGSLPFLSFEAVIDKLKNTLLHTAAFVLTETPTITDIPDEAREYLTRCRFLQTAVGSYITRVQLPEREQLVAPTLFDEGLASKAVTTTLADSLEFISTRVLSDDQSIYTDDSFEQEVPRINVDVFKDIGELLEKSGARSIDFTMTSSDGVKTIQSGPLSAYRLARLEHFIGFARDRLAADREIDVVGRIVELRSRRPDQRTNHVGISAVLDDHEVFIAMTMGKQDYPYAVMAHNRNHLVRLRAAVRTMRTQLRVITLTSFEELEESAESTTAP